MTWDGRGTVFEFEGEVAPLNADMPGRQGITRDRFLQSGEHGLLVNGFVVTHGSKSVNRLAMAVGKKVEAGMSFGGYGPCVWVFHTSWNADMSRIMQAFL